MTPVRVLMLPLCPEFFRAHLAMPKSSTLTRSPPSAWISMTFSG